MMTPEKKPTRNKLEKKETAEFNMNQPDVSEIPYGQGPKIEDSPYKDVYDQIDKLLLDSYPENKSLYKKCGIPSCESNSFCSYVKMEPIRDKLAQRTQPLAFGQSNQGRRMNDEYSSIDFPDRNLTLKKDYIRVVATEESLDNWHA